MRVRAAAAFLVIAAMLILFSGCTPGDDVTQDTTPTAVQTIQATATVEAMPTPVPTPGPTLSPSPSPTPTAEPTPTPSPTPSPTPEPLTVTVTKEHLTVTSGVCRYDVYVPVFAVTGSDTLLPYLNAQIRSEMLAIVTRFTNWAAANPPVPPAGLNDLSFDFEVTRNDGQYLSLYGIASAYMGGATTTSFGFSFTVNVANQTVPTMATLLGSDYQLPVSALIKSELAADFGDAPVTANLFGIAPGSDFVTGDNPHFYLTPSHMGFIFDKYTLYPGAYGAPRVEVPISDLPGPFGGGAAETHMALCTGFNSATGAMVFDYVEILTDGDAVTALAADQGITQAQAHDIIYDHDPHEYIRNQNPLLRTFTVNASTYIAMIYGSDGAIVDPGGYFISYADFTSLYAVRPGAVVSEYQLYSITVSGSRVLAMEQVYRP